jgi:hypothetical protein
MKRVAWTLALCLTAPLAVGCDSGDSSEADSGASSDTDASEDSSGGDNEALGCAAEIEHDTTDGATEDRQMTWGAPCTEDSECVALLGTGGVCLNQAVIYELPQGYCTKTCVLPPDTQYSENDEQCDPNGGVDCIGEAPLLQVCAPQCTDDAQCTRDGYTCRNFPLIAMEGDPTYCLMPDCCEGSCAEE